MGTKLGLFFSIDALIGSMLLVTTMLLVSNLYTHEAPSVRFSYQASDMATFLTNVQNADLKDAHSISLMQNGTISDTQLTIVEQMALSYGRGQTSLLTNYTREALQGYFPTVSGYGIYIDGTPIYEKNISTTQFRSTARRLVRVMDGSSVNAPVFYGPYEVQVRVWG